MQIIFSSHHVGHFWDFQTVKMITSSQFWFRLLSYSYQCTRLGFFSIASHFAIISLAILETFKLWGWSLSLNFDSVSETDLIIVNSSRLWHLSLLQNSVFASFKQKNSFPSTSLDLVIFLVTEQMLDKAMSFSFGLLAQLSSW